MKVGNKNMENEKLYYIKCYELINGEYRYYGYFEELIITDIFQDKVEINISTISDIKYAKRYKKRGWAENKVLEIIEKTKNNVFCFDDDGKYKYKFEIIEI